MRIFANANYPFLRWRRKSYVVSGIIIGAGILAMVINTFTLGSWLRYGVDFTGGTMVHVSFSSPVQVDQIRAVNNDWQITRFGEVDESEFMIRIAAFEERLDADPASEVTGGLTEAFGEGSFEVIRREAVSARVGSELQQRALFAILISLLGILIYIAFRFEWRFGLAAVVGTAYDVILTLAIIALLRIEVSVTIVAAVLTVAGYSLNDTIVVFDRIRENLSKAGRSVSLATVTDRSINETLPRTVVTSVTSLAVLFSLYLFGGAVIRDFTFLLILGISFGTLSTIFVSAPALIEITTRWPKQAKKATSGPAGSRRKTAAARV